MCLFVYFTIDQHNTWVCIYLNDILRKRTCVVCTLPLHYKPCLSALSLLLQKPCIYVYGGMLYYSKGQADVCTLLLHHKACVLYSCITKYVVCSIFPFTAKTTFVCACTLPLCKQTQNRSTIDQ